MGKFNLKVKQLIKYTVRPVYYLPYNIQLLIKRKDQKLLLPGADTVREILKGREKVVGVASAGTKIEKIKKRICRLKMDEYFSQWTSVDKIVKDRNDNTFYILFELFEYSSMAQKLHRIGLKDGKDFILLLDGEKYRTGYKETVKQRKWIEVEKFRKVNKENWINRIILMKNLIGTQNKSVLDIGCWESELKEYLGSSVKYYGCDYVKRGNDTIVCNLNNYEFPTIDFDVAYISGSLEYMENLDWYFDQICKANNEIILSYSLLEYFPLIDRRKRKSWVNHLTAVEIIEYMKRRNFLLTASEFWGKWTVIFKFERKNVV